MLFRKNIQFSRLIKAGAGLKEFNFRKPNSADEEMYEVDVSDEKGNRISFRMILNQEQWRLQDGLLPAWISAAEPFLQEAIGEQEKVL